MSRHDHADNMINAQIHIELSKLNSILTDEEDKPAIISRIAELKAMLGPTPSQVEPLQLSPKPITLADIANAFRRR